MYPLTHCIHIDAPHRTFERVHPSSGRRRARPPAAHARVVVVVGSDDPIDRRDGRLDRVGFGVRDDITRARAREHRIESDRIGSDRIGSMRSKSAPLRMRMRAGGDGDDDDDLRDGASSSSGLTSRRTKTANKRKVMMRRGRKDGLRYVRDERRARMNE